MSAEVITLGKEVVVSDPCYSIPTWCQTILTSVLPGRYIVQVNEDPDSGRNAELLVIHEDHYQKDLKFEDYGSCGVDSGQLGVFDAASYRNDAIAPDIMIPGDFVLPGELSDGDKWYEAMCRYTLGNEQQWGSYDAGVVSSSGWGDGVYPLEISKDQDGNIVAMLITFIFPEDEDEYEDEADCCSECGAEFELDGTCSYCEHFKNSKNED